MEGCNYFNFIKYLKNNLIKNGIKNPTVGTDEVQS